MAPAKKALDALYEYGSGLGIAGSGGIAGEPSVIIIGLVVTLLKALSNLSDADGKLV